MAFSISSASANNILDTFLSNFANGVIEIRDGIRPPDSDSPPTGKVLATIPLGANPFNPAVNRTATLSSPVKDPAGDANGSATWFRMYDNTNTALAVNILDGDVGPLGSGADMELDDGAGGTAITTADTITITNLTISL